MVLTSIIIYLHNIKIILKTKTFKENINNINVYLSTEGCEVINNILRNNSLINLKLIETR